jgi:hypothetical protein
VELLASQFNVNTDPETLMNLPFELVLDAEARALFGS